MAPSEETRSPLVLSVYWDTLTKEDREQLANLCDKSTDYLRQVFKYGRKVSGTTALALEKYTDGYCPRQLFRPDLYPPKISIPST